MDHDEWAPVPKRDQGEPTLTLKPSGRTPRLADMERHQRKLRKHSQEMRDAAVRAVLEQGYKAPEVVELAAEGRLDGLPPFEISPSTVNDLVGRAGKERDQAAGDTDPVLEEMREVARRTIERVKQLDTPSAKDMSALQQAHRLLQQADRADLRRLPSPARPESDELSEAEYARRFAATLADRDKAIGPGPCQCDPPMPCWWPAAHKLLEQGKDPQDASSWGKPVCYVCHLPIDNWEGEPDPDVDWVRAIAAAA